MEKVIAESSIRLHKFLESSLHSRRHRKVDADAPATPSKLKPVEKTKNNKTDRGSLGGDLAGGLAATLAGLPTELNYGLMILAPLGAAFAAQGVLMALYACLVAGLVTALAGSRAGIINGTRPGSNLILAGLVADLLARPFTSSVMAGTEGILLAVLATTLMAGALQTLFGLLRLGQVIRFMPYPVLAGLTNGIAAHMAVAALPAALGLAAGAALGGWRGAHPLSLLVVGICLWVTFRPGPVLRRWPVGLAPLLIGTLAFYLLNWLGAGTWLGGFFTSVPPTLPSLETASHLAGLVVHPDYLLEVIPRLWPYSFAIAALMSLESLVGASGADQLLNGQHNGDRELVAQGVGNMASALAGGVPTAPTLSRMTANVQSGGRTPRASMIYALLILLVLLFVVGVIGYLPAVVPAALMIAIALNMVDKWSINLVRQVVLHRHAMTPEESRQLIGHLAVMLLVVAVALGKGLMWAVGIGVISSMLVFVNNNIKPVVRRSYNGQFQHSLRMRCGDESDHLLREGQRIVVAELDGAIFFGTTARLSQEVWDAAQGADYVVLDLRRVGEIDATGVRVLQQLAKRLKAVDKLLMLSHMVPDSPLGRFLARMELGSAIPELWWFPDTDSALEHCEDLLLRMDGVSRETGQAELPLAQSGLAAGLSVEQEARLRKYLERVELAEGEVLFRNGEPGDSLFLVAQGSVSIRVPSSASEHSPRLAAFGPGIVLGEMAVIEGKPRSADAIADESSVLYRLDRQHFDRLCAEDPALGARLLMQISIELAGRLRTTTLSLRELSLQ